VENLFIKGFTKLAIHSYPHSKRGNPHTSLALLLDLSHPMNRHVGNLPCY
jgi:hypothetical protein